MTSLEFIYYTGYAIKKRYAYKHQKHLPCKVISVGNITTGGTGKTPATIAIAEEAKRRGLSPVILTRGYMGKAKGPCLVKGSGVLSTPGITHQASLLYGDEPVLMADRLKDVPVVKCSDRYEGGIFALSSLQHSNTPFLFILDDGFQHWKLYRDIDIVLVDGLNPFGNRRMLPMGVLREPLEELKRADIFVVTKTKNGALSDELRDINPKAPIYFSEYRVHEVSDIDGNRYGVEVLKDKRIYAFCGIANPDSFKQTLSSIAAEVRGFKAYRDHYRYTEKDVAHLKGHCKALNCDLLVTTEKDMVKLREIGPSMALSNLLCIGIRFCVDKDFYDAIF